MKYAIATIMLLVSLTAQSRIFSRNGTGPNIISFEGGLFHRGLVGVSYNRLLLDRKRIFAAGGGGLGFGFVPFAKGLNRFYYISTCFGIGLELNRAKFYITPGLELKYISYYDTHSDEQNNYYSVHGQGIGFAQFIGLTVIEDNVFMQMRMAPFCIVESSMSDIGIGFTLGKMF